MDWVALLTDTAVARALTRWPLLYIVASAAHILSIGVLFGSVLALDLRLLGLLRALPISPAVRSLSGMAATGLAVAVATGFVLFLVRPAEYLQNTAFLAKLALVALGTANALVIRGIPGWSQVLEGREAARPVRVAAILSVTIWICAVLAGRWIGFL